MTMTKAEKAALNRQIARAGDLVYLECRVGAERHKWSLRRPDFTADYGTAVAHQCDVCLAVRRTVVSKLGEVLGRTYEYPEGYQYVRKDDDPQFETMISPQSVRAAYLARIEANLASLPELISLSKGGDA